jgi:uncharacterized repeat protein (TIGR01451 family)
VKTADKTVILSGELVLYSYVVTNPGDDPLSSVGVVDNSCSPVVKLPGGDNNSNGLLDPGEVWHYQCATAVSVDTLNTATASGNDSLGNPVSDLDTEFVDVVDPQINIEKNADRTVVLPGDLVQYTYLVTNPGDVPLASVNVTDDRCAPVTFVGGDIIANGLLDPGEIWVYTCTTSVLTDTTNTATAIGQPSDSQGIPLPGIDPVSDQDTQFVDVVSPAINIVKTANPTMIYAGEAVVYTYEVTNPGDVPLANPAVTDDFCSPVLPIPGGDTNLNGLLDPGEVWTYICTDNLGQDRLNTGTATGQPSDAGGQPLPGIGPVNDQDTAYVEVINPEIHIVKTPNATQVLPGETVIYTYEVTNPGDDPLRNVGVVDNTCSPVNQIGGDFPGQPGFGPGHRLRGCDYRWLDDRQERQCLDCL